MFERLLLPLLFASERSVLLLGPRQVGKSTLLGLLKPDLALNFADPGVHRRFLARPEQLLEVLRAAPDSTRVVLLDEVQKVPALLDAVQRGKPTRQSLGTSAFAVIKAHRLSCVFNGKRRRKFQRRIN